MSRKELVFWVVAITITSLVALAAIVFGQVNNYPGDAHDKAHHGSPSYTDCINGSHCLSMSALFRDTHYRRDSIHGACDGERDGWTVYSQALKKNGVKKTRADNGGADGRCEYQDFTGNAKAHRVGIGTLSGIDWKPWNTHRK